MNQVSLSVFDHFVGMALKGLKGINRKSFAPGMTITMISKKGFIQSSLILLNLKPKVTFGQFLFYSTFLSCAGPTQAEVLSLSMGSEFISSQQ